MENKNFAKAMEDLALWSASSTIWYLAKESADEKTRELKNGLNNGKYTLKQCEYLAEQIGIIENAIKSNKNEIALLNRENAILNKRLKEFDIFTDSGENMFLECHAQIERNNEEIKALTAVNKQYHIDLIPLYDCLLDKSIADGFELKQVAFLAIWEYAEQIKEHITQYNFNDVDILMQAIASIEFKTETIKYIEYRNLKKLKKEYKVIAKSKNNQIYKVIVYENLTVKKIGDKAVRAFINQNKKFSGAKTQPIIIGYGDEGEELVIQTSKLETLGGIDNLQDKIIVDKFLAECEQKLTLRQIEVLKLLMLEYTQTEIAEKLGIKTQSTICKHIEKIRNAVKTTEMYLENEWLILDRVL